MKKMIFIFVLTFFSILFNQNTCKATVDCYAREGEGCGEWVEYFIPINIPEFSCPINAHFRKRDCPDNKSQIQLLDLSYSFNDPNCLTMMQCIYPLYPNKTVINWACVETIWESTYSQLSYMLFLQASASYTNEDKENFLCGSGHFVISISYFKDVCRKFCAYDVEEPTGGAPPYSILVEGSCTLEFCCKYEKKYCYVKVWNTNTQQFDYFPNVEESKTKDENAPDCSKINPNLYPCPNGYTISPECMESCK